MAGGERQPDIQRDHHERRTGAGEFNLGDRVSVVHPVTKRFNQQPDILPTHVGVVVAGGDRASNSTNIDFGGDIGEVIFGTKGLPDEIRKVD